MRRLGPSIPVLAVFLSVLLHLAALLPAVVGLGGTETEMPPGEPGTIELLPVEIAGADAADPAQDRPTQDRPAQDKLAQDMVAQDMLARGDPPADDADDPAPRLAEPTAGSVTPAARASEPNAITFHFAGTDSASSAIASGPNMIPASIEDSSRNRPPVYPMEAARRGQEGTVVLLIRVSPMGLAEGAAVTTSSGHSSLDQAAVDAVMRWRFRPAVRDGRAVPFEMPMRIVFAMR